MKIERFEDLEIWKLARDLYKYVFLVSSIEPFNSDFRLRDQIRASSGSVSDNISEGFERGGNKELVQFLYVAKGSCGETRNQSYRAFDSNYIDQKTLDTLPEKTIILNQQISNFIKYIKSSNFRGEKYQ
ncbi:MAG TPA: four helix bundle protein [Bacteroidales bacterium]|nr:four helix bundle protein [Bacteroidales bacterium]